MSLVSTLSWLCIRLIRQMVCMSQMCCFLCFFVLPAAGVNAQLVSHPRLTCCTWLRITSLARSGHTVLNLTQAKRLERSKLVLRSACRTVNGLLAIGGPCDRGILLRSNTKPAIISLISTPGQAWLGPCEMGPDRSRLEACC